MRSRSKHLCPRTDKPIWCKVENYGADMLAKGVIELEIKNQQVASQTEQLGSNNTAADALALNRLFARASKSLSLDLRNSKNKDGQELSFVTAGGPSNNASKLATEDVTDTLDCVQGLPSSETSSSLMKRSLPSTRCSAKSGSETAKDDIDVNAPNDDSNLVDRNLPPAASLPKSKKRRLKEQQLFATSPTEEQLEVASQASSRNMFVTPDKKKARQGTAMDRLAAQQEALNKKLREHQERGLP